MKGLKKLLLPTFLLTASMLLFQHCSKDNPTQPAEIPTETLASQSIGTSGGTLETDNVQIEIPAGTFTETKNVKITSSNISNNFNTNSVSDFISLEGLPTNFNKSIKIKIKYKGTLSDEKFIAVGEENYVKSVNGNSYAFRLVSAKDSSGFLVASIDPLESDNLGKIISAENSAGDDLSLNIGAIAGYVSYKSSANHFIINFPSSVLTDAYDLADYLEEAYTKFSNMGFNLSRRSKWPVEVNVKKLDGSVYGYSYNSVWGNNYGYMEFNVDKMSNKEELKVTAGHEFFHLVQSLYDPRNSFSKAKFQSPNLWLDEASAVWSEYLFSSSGSSYVSSIFGTNAYEMLNGAKTAEVSSDAQSYGYSLASLIKYIVSKNGINSLVNIYDKIYAGKSAFDAAGSVLTAGLDYSWSNYLKSLFSFQLYNGNSFGPATLVSTAKIKSQNFVIQSEADSVKTFKSSLSDLSATVFSVKNEFTKLNRNAQLIIACKDWSFHVFKVNGSESTLLGTKKDSLVVKDFKDLVDNGYQIAVVLFNDDLSLPYDSKNDYELEIKVNAPKTVQYIYFAVAYTGTKSFTTPDETTYSTFENIGISGIVYDKNHQISSNNINISQDSTDIYNHLLTNINLTVDDLENPSQIYNFSFDQTEKSVNYNVTRTKSAAGSSVPFEVDNYGKSGLIFSYTGNIKQYLSKLTDYEKQIAYDNITTYITDLVSYEPDGTIQIIINYE